MSNRQRNLASAGVGPNACERLEEDALAYSFRTRYEKALALHHLDADVAPDRLTGRQAHLGYLRAKPATLSRGLWSVLSWLADDPL
jgi:hypothetical protein